MRLSVTNGARPTTTGSKGHAEPTRGRRLIIRSCDVDIDGLAKLLGPLWFGAEYAIVWDGVRRDVHPVRYLSPFYGSTMWRAMA